MTKRATILAAIFWLSPFLCLILPKPYLAWFSIGWLTIWIGMGVVALIAGGASSGQREHKGYMDDVDGDGM